MSNEAAQYIQWGILLAIGGSAVWFNWKLGLSSASKNLIQTLKDQHDLDIESIQKKEKLINELQAENKAYIAEVSAVHAKVMEKDKIIGDLTAVLQGRDSQTQRFQEEGFKAIKEAREIRDTLERIEKQLKLQRGNIDGGKA